MRALLGKTVFLYILSCFYVAASYACSTCFGDPNSQMAQGVNGAVLLMLGVIGVVLALFVALFVYFARRAKQLDEQEG